MALTRYDLDTCDGISGNCVAQLVKCKDGDWVAYDDVKGLLDNVLYELNTLADSFKYA